jgi:hypothetical protein
VRRTFHPDHKTIAKLMWLAAAELRRQTAAEHQAQLARVRNGMSVDLREMPGKKQARREYARLCSAYVGIS